MAAKKKKKCGPGRPPASEAKLVKRAEKIALLLHKRRVCFTKK